MSRMPSLLCAVLLFTVSLAVHSQAYPNKPVRLLVGFAAGGSTDITARIVAAKLSEFWGQQLVVENRTGAGGNIAAEIAAKATPDGYTLLIFPTAFAINPSMYKKIPYDPLRDFAPVSLLGTTPNVMSVHPSVPAKSVREFVSHAKANPGKLNYGSSGVGTAVHLSMELFKSMTSTNIVHVPYKGAAPLLADLLGGHIAVVISNLPAQLAYIKAGRLRALGVTTVKRSTQLPEVSTLIEAGLAGFDVTVWYGMSAQAAVPKPILAKLNADVVKALKLPDLQQRLAEQGVDAAPNAPGEFAAFVKSETAKWAKVVKDAGVTAE